MKNIDLIPFKYLTPILFVLLMNSISAQTVSLSPEQCGHAIQFGKPIFCTTNDSATEYEFKFFTSEDTAIITSQINYILAETYYNILQTNLAYRTIVRCKFGENWGEYGDTCITKIVIDWFSEMQALYDTNNQLGNRSDSLCHASNLDSLYTIPVVFHVVVPTTFTGENIVDYLPPDKINEQLKIINEFFAGERAVPVDSAGNANIHFCFAKKDVNGEDLNIDYNGVTYFGITYRSPYEGINVSVDEIAYPGLFDNEMHACSYYSRFPRNKYLNIFVFDQMSRQEYYGEGGSVRSSEGIAQFSFIRIRHDVVGENPEMRSENKNKGYTAVHELGHFFGLKHTFPQSLSEIPDTLNPHRMMELQI